VLRWDHSRERVSSQLLVRYPPTRDARACLARDERSVGAAAPEGLCSSQMWGRLRSATRRLGADSSSGLSCVAYGYRLHTSLDNPLEAS
jgi:hypothetical protein